MSKINRIIYFFISLVFFVLLDGYFSHIIINSGCCLPENAALNFVLVQNTGAAFNLFEGARVFLIVFSILAIFAIIWYTMKNIKKYSVFMILFSSILTAGIFYNMLERLMYGYVRDYIELKFIDFPIFNISDIFINVAVFSIVFIVLKNNYIKNNENNN